jgi:ubiquitin-like domain-containing CTD phosphatase 1
MISPENSIAPRGNIILNIDCALGDHIPKHFAENPDSQEAYPIPRPGLRKFLRFVFTYYERVSIWTTSSQEWYNKFKKSVLIPNMPQNKTFHFEKTKNTDKPFQSIKSLIEIYEMYPEYNSSNTIIVDDSLRTFRENINNAVHVPPFYYSMMGTTPDKRILHAARDDALYNVIKILQERIFR